ncbi:hypothetical protein N474_25705 [Pseudoalteromonas luteoviolacea CPMOR-2]|uniref:hypothetical protein n=1 Tax=Pseudoalteromonas luteoviolacea TaxID=43657 RepID=UPI0007B054B6|nr:hypothetical protein [Pseudoalteromonas luteoviolacea]KZN57460.1 hypothetical protein N474_25705 [Pseudoalteromonas luteoviolacea CPMOR-2]
MTFKQTLTISILAAFIPAIVAGVISLFTFFSVNQLDEKIKDLESRAKAIDLYNQFSPNARFSIGRLEYGVFYNIDEIRHGKRDEFVNRFQSIEENYGASLYRRKYINKLKDLVYEFSSSQHTVNERLRFNYCVENKGKVEMFFYEPIINFYTKFDQSGALIAVKKDTTDHIGVIPSGGLPVIRLIYHIKMYLQVIFSLD